MVERPLRTLKAELPVLLGEFYPGGRLEGIRAFPLYLLWAAVDFSHSGARLSHGCNAHKRRPYTGGVYGCRRAALPFAHQDQHVRMTHSQTMHMTNATGKSAL
jgi:hypothetical protein